MSDIQLLDQRIKKLDALSKEVDKDSAKYKTQPEHLKNVKADIEKQKAVCQQEKNILTEYQNHSSDYRLAEANTAANEKALKEAAADHEKLKKELGKKYKGSYNAITNTIDDSKWSQADKAKYLASRENREKLKKYIENDKKRIVELRARQEELKKEYKKLVKDNKDLHTNKGVAEPCVPCLTNKIKGQDPKKHFIKFTVKDDKGKMLSDISFKVELPDGNVAEATSDNGKIDIKNIEPGNCKVETDWKELTIDQVVFFSSW